MAITQGRNDGRKNRGKTMTSDSVAQTPPVTNTRRVEEEVYPTLFIKTTAPRDVLDTGLEDSQWHYLWVNVHDPVGLSSYYQDGYRFVRFDDVKSQLAQDELRSFLYTADENNRVRYGDENRLMRIPQETYQARHAAGLKGSRFNAAEKALQVLQAGIEQGKHNGTFSKDIAVNADDDNGDVVETKIEGGN